MQHYYVNKQAQENGVHQVHTPRCTYLPEGDAGLHLGTFISCEEALRAARQQYEKVCGCQWCCGAGRTG